MSISSNNTDDSLSEIISVVSTVVPIIMTTTHQRKTQRRRIYSPPPARRPNRRTFGMITDHWSSRKFKRNFRMCRTFFSILLEQIRSKISTYTSDEDQLLLEAQDHIRRRTTQASTKLAVFLRVMAGGEHEDVANVFDVGSSTVRVILDECLHALENVLEFQPFPRTAAEFKESAVRFACSRSFNNPLPGCIAALDGIAIALARPRRIYNPSLFYNRKGYYAIPVQAMVDSDCRFLCISILCVGSTHDSLAFDVSHMARYILEGYIPIGPWVSADEAYSGGEIILVPFRGQILTLYLDGFNFYHSSHRVHIEQAFGQLVRKWKILKREMSYSLPVCTKIIKVAALLQNFCKKFDSPPPTEIPEERRREAEADFDEWIRWRANDDDASAWLGCVVDTGGNEAVNVALRASETRRRLALSLQRYGIKRPDWAGIHDRLQFAFNSDSESDIE